MFRTLLVFILTATLAFAQEERESFIEKMSRYHDFINALAMGSLDSRGLSFDALFKPNLPSYDQVLSDIEKDLKSSKCHNFDCPGYQEDFSAIANSHIAHAKELKLLPNAESFELRRHLMTSAKSSIHVVVWAVYDDETGREFRDLLLESLKRNPGLDIRLIVDGNVANLWGRKVLKEIEKQSAGKIKVMRWKSRKYRANGTHRKIIIVDDEHVIVGGMNIGNAYSHHPAARQKWRDLDVYIRGEKAGEMADIHYAEIWNRQIAEFPKLAQKLGMMSTTEVLNRDTGPSVVFVDQFPGSAVDKAYHNIHTSIVKLFRDARKTIDIENAYFIMDPIIKRELEATIRRGVQVRLYTNSDKSADEPIVSTPVMHSALELLKMGGRIFLREGTTLHSKFMVVDGRVSMIGSFNFHPRSLRFDAENVAVVFDEAFAGELTRHFDEGLKDAREYTDPKDLKLDWSLLHFFIKTFYFDFL